MEKCKVAKICGGCQFQGVEYDRQLQRKQEYVEKLYSRYQVKPIIGMEDPYHYRNKVQVAFGRANGRVICGNYVTSTHQIVEIKDCQITDRKANEIIEDIRKLIISFRLTVFDENTMKGFLRHVLVRTGHISGQIMVVLVTGSYQFPKKKDFIDALLKKHPEITTVVQNINSAHTSMVLSEKSITLYGKGYIEDVLCEKVFRISANSFYQVNSIQTEKLYGAATEMAQLEKSDTVIDAYCGIGTIGISVADKVKQVLAVEINKQAIRDARVNAKLNDVENIRFSAMDAGKFMRKLAYEKTPVDVVIMDPARAGADEPFLSSLVKLKPRKVVYISCNPDTQRRDISYLSKHGYQVEELQPVDMFPFTEHVESICLLTRR
ncbi:MAG: 23S rRNA (uracil(1939)-C(5))-methyltransferase RlmD [Erysipelotrichaceae bacterium]|nr:23S rRNA (uracil(1939)-C(5))-methyltransferase RlmD [Erysipelotrichaceae bacterium]